VVSNAATRDLGRKQWDIQIWVFMSESDDAKKCRFASVKSKFTFEHSAENDRQLFAGSLVVGLIKPPLGRSRSVVGRIIMTRRVMQK